MEKENKEEEKIDISKFLPELPPDEAAFIKRCNGNDECRELIQAVLPRLATGKDTPAGVLKAIGTYGVLGEIDYLKTVAYYKRKVLTKWDKRFLNLVAQLRGILKPADECDND